MEIYSVGNPVNNLRKVIRNFYFPEILRDFFNLSKQKTIHVLCRQFVDARLELGDIVECYYRIVNTALCHFSCSRNKKYQIRKRIKDSIYSSLNIAININVNFQRSRYVRLVEEVQASIQDISSDRENHIKSNELLLLDNQRLSQENIRLVKEMELLSLELDAYKSQFDRVENVNRELSEALAQSDSKYVLDQEKLQSKIKSLESTVQQKTELLNELQQSKIELAQEEFNLRKDVKDKEHQIAKLVEVTSSKDFDLRNLTKELNSMKGFKQKYLKVQSFIDGKDEQLKNLEDQLAKKYKLVGDLNRSLRDKDNLINSLQKEYEDYKSRRQETGNTLESMSELGDLLGKIKVDSTKLRTLLRKQGIVDMPSWTLKLNKKTSVLYILERCFREINCLS